MAASALLVSSAYKILIFLENNPEFTYFFLKMLSMERSSESQI